MRERSLTHNTFNFGAVNFLRELVDRPVYTRLHQTMETTAIIIAAIAAIVLLLAYVLRSGPSNAAKGKEGGRRPANDASHAVTDILEALQTITEEPKQPLESHAEALWNHIAPPLANLQTRYWGLIDLYPEHDLKYATTPDSPVSLALYDGMAEMEPALFNAAMAAKMCGNVSKGYDAEWAFGLESALLRIPGSVRRLGVALGLE